VCSSDLEDLHNTYAFLMAITRAAHRAVPEY